MSPRPGGDVSNSSEFATMGSGEYRAGLERRRSAAALAVEATRRHTALVLVLIYLVVTVVARVQELWFFRFFRVNILNYSGAQDFFVASMRDPAVWLYFLVPTAVLFIVSWLLARGRGSEFQPPPEMRRGAQSFAWNTPEVRLALSVVLVIAIAATLARMNALRRFNAAAEGRGRHVTFARTDGITYNERPIILGSTGTFFFLYYSQRKVTEIIPVENTALMTVDLHPTSEQSRPGSPGGSVGDSPRLSP